jgi:hypothetical protein
LAQQLHLVLYVKELIACDLPPAAVEDKVREYLTRPAPTGVPPIIPKPAARRRGPSAAIGGTAAAALLIGGVIGGLIGAGRNDSSPVTAAAPTVTVEAAAPLDRAIPNTPDPVCAEWAPLANLYSAKLAEWAKTDSNIPATSWTSEQLAVNLAAIPVLRSNAADMNRLAAKASDPFLASLMHAQAAYSEEFISRIPTYQPSDLQLWQASVDMSGAVQAACVTVKPR